VRAAALCVNFSRENDADFWTATLGAARPFTKTRCRYSRPARLLGGFLLDRAACAA